MQRPWVVLSVTLLLLVSLIGPTSIVVTGTENGTNGIEPSTTTNRTINLPPISANTLGDHSRSVAPLSTATEGRQVVIVLHPNGTEQVGQLETHGATVEAVAGRYVQATVAPSDRPAIGALPWVRDIRDPHRAHPIAVSEGVAAIGADAVHDRSITGRNVTVGVIDVGFDPQNPEISANVVDYKSFTGDIAGPGEPDHGTAVSEIVVDTAPNASLYLANVDTMVEFSNAVDWLESKDVDVISVSLAWYAAPFDGTSLASQAATGAADSGIVFVSAAGNAAQYHWEGPYESGDGDRWANFTGTSETNYLNDGDTIDRGTTVNIYLSWNDWNSPSEDYDLYLYREGQAIDNWTARSIREQASLGVDPWEQLSVQIPETGKYYLAIRERDASGSERLELFAVDGDLQINNATSSITAPAVAKNTTAVGAFRYSSGALEDFSSHGPTNDGRRGLDVTGPDGVSTSTYAGGFFGTSAAAPHVSGVAALVLARNPDLTPAQVADILTGTATDTAEDGADVSTGFGRINASLAVNRSVADIAATSFTVTPTTAAVGESVTVEATVTNRGLVSGNDTIPLQIDGQAVQSRSVSLGPDETTTVRFDHSFDAIGDHRVSVDGLAAETLSVPANLAFEDQVVASGASNVTIDVANATTSYYVQISNASGAVIGQSQAFAAGAGQSAVTVSVSTNLTTGQQLTATIRAASDDRALGSDTAQISIAGDAPQYLRTADGNGDRTIGDIEVLSAIDAWRQGQTYGDLEILDVIDYWRTGQTI